MLARPKTDSIDTTLALLTAGVFLFIIFNAFPFLAFKKEGFVQQSHLATGIVQLFRQGMTGVACLVALTTIIAPGLQFLMYFYILLPSRFGRKAPGMFHVFRYLRVLQPWGMVEVFMLGVLVSIVKLSKMATIVPGPAVWSLVGLMFVLAAAAAALDPHEVWDRWGETPIRQPLPTTLNSGLVGCGVCHLLVPAPDPKLHARCPRCGAALHRRKPNSLHRTWALVIAALIFYIPANVLPITIVTSLGMTQADTIMSGVIYFMHEGAWAIAGVIFIASIFVPLMKLIILIYLLVTVQSGSTARMKDRTRLYRITEAVGRWSMVDIFVVTILVALVNLGALASLKAGPAAPFFAAVVVITIFAAMSFDPRLIWDAKEQTHD